MDIDKLILMLHGDHFYVDGRAGMGVRLRDITVKVTGYYESIELDYEIYDDDKFVPISCKYKIDNVSNHAKAVFVDMVYQMVQQIVPAAVQGHEITVIRKQTVSLTGHYCTIHQYRPPPIAIRWGTCD